MNKQDVKNILMSMRTVENENYVNNLLGKIDLLDDVSFVAATEKVGNTEESIRSFFEEKLLEAKVSNIRNEPKYPINKMFTYGVNEDNVHLHLPGNLRQMVEEKKLSGTMDTINLYLLDAIDKIATLRDEGFFRFQGVNNIYMISPILINRELRFLNEMDFSTNLYMRRNLKDNIFLAQHPEARLATTIFGKEKNIGVASISFNIISSDGYQNKKRKKIEEFAEKGITLEENVESLEVK